MKKEIIISILAAAALCGCQKEEQSIPDSNQKPFIATIEDNFSGPETKTSLDSQGNVLWKQGDQISIFAGSTINEQWQVTDASDGKTAAGLNKVSGAGFNAGGEIDNNVAFYPYSSENTVAKSEGNYVIGAVLPSVQNYAEASFGNGAFPMSAVTSSTTDMNLKFKNILGGLKLQLKGTATIASISISGNNDEILCGAANVTASVSSKPSINLTDGSAKTVTLDCGDGVQLDADAATPFVIALPPMTMTGGFTVTVTDTEGKQMEIKTTKSQTIARSSILKMPAVVFNGIKKIDYLTEPLTIKSTGNTTISITYRSASVDLINLEYKKGSNDWTEYVAYTPISLSDGETLQFRAGEGGNDVFGDEYGNTYFNVSGEGTIEAYGNVMSIFDRTLVRTDVPQHGFHYMFNGCSNLTDVSNLKLPATTLGIGCYYGMFGFTSITNAPELPATELVDQCYDMMFYNCSQLTLAPELPATTLAYRCYGSMFGSCTSLITAPELRAEALARSCYQGMFSGCKSLSEFPELPAETLARACYMGMFQNCGNLTPPTLPATTLAEYCYEQMFTGSGITSAPKLPVNTLVEGCYYGMFENCTSLKTAPELPATTLTTYCYYEMFKGCSSLNSITMLATNISASNCLTNWVSGVASSGTFVKNKEAVWDVTGKNGVPSGWTVLTE